MSPVLVAASLLAMCGPAMAEPLKIVAWDAAGSRVQASVQYLRHFRPLVYAITRTTEADVPAIAAGLESAHSVPYEKLVLGEEGAHNPVHTALIYDSSSVVVKQVVNHPGFSVTPHGGSMVTVLVASKRPGTFLDTLLAVCTIRSTREVDRVAQASRLREWTRRQKKPVLVVGSFSFQVTKWDTQGDRAFEELTRKRLVKWVRPLSVSLPRKSKAKQLRSLVFLGGDRFAVSPSLELRRPEDVLQESKSIEQPANVVSVNRAVPPNKALSRAVATLARIKAKLDADTSKLNGNKEALRALEALQESISRLRAATSD